MEMGLGIWKPFKDAMMMYTNSLTRRLYTKGLMNSFRTETFNLSSNGETESFLIQGGLRWQSITLLTNTSLTINGVGLRPSVDILPSESLPGAFSTSNDQYDRLWSLGARAVQAACVENGSQPSTWELSSEGAFIRGQYPGYSLKGLLYGNYTMSFSTKVRSGGTGWRVAAGANSGYGPYFVLTTSGPHFANMNRSLTPANTLAAGFGFSIINEAILSSGPVQYFDLPMTLVDNEWYRVATTINATGYDILINGTRAAFVPSAEYVPYVDSSWGSPTVTDGTWGFGPWLDQAAYFRDVEVTLQNGTVVYTNTLTTSATLEEYGIASNSHAVCLDGAKRDREIWIGDFVHTAREIFASSGRFDFVQSMIEFALEWQLVEGQGAGLVPIQESMGDGFQYRYAYYPSQYSESDYPILFLVTLGDYYAQTGDISLLGTYWDGIKLLVQTILDRYLDPATGLLAAADAFWFTAQGFQNATAPTALMAIALNQLVNVSNALNDTATASSYASQSANFSSAINSQLYSSSLGAYAIALDGIEYTSILATAFTIRAGIANSTQAQSGIEKLADLFVQIGYKDSSNVAESNTTQLSPNTQGFLLESLFLAHNKLNASAATVVPVLKNLLDVYWPNMLNQNEYYTGGPWEYVYADGSPGIGIFTSLCHPWGGAPTYILTNYVLGVRTEFNSTTGTFEWVFDPPWDIALGLGLQWANGTVPLFSGGYIQAEWTLSNGTNSSSISVQVIGNSGVQVTVI